MSEILDRAARALCLSSSEDGPEHVDVSMELDGDEWRDHAKAVLLAAFDLEDDKLTERIAKRIYISRTYGQTDDVRALKWADPRMREAYRADAQNALLALRSIVNDVQPKDTAG